MEIILLGKIQNLGESGDLVNVRNGYARNYLIPQKKAMMATAEAKAEVEERKRQLAEEEQKRLDEARARAEQAVREITLSRLCGEEGQLYGSVSPVDISEALAEAGTQIEKSEITQPDGPIKQVGEFEADVILHPEVRFTLKITVEGELSDGSGWEEPEAGEETADADSEAPAAEESTED